MIVFLHRCNDLKIIDRAKNLGIGFEIDIRSRADGLVVAHDPFMDKALPLSAFSEQIMNSPVIFNVKEEGLEPYLYPYLEIASKESFILDESLPYIIKFSKRGCAQFAIRVSDIESEHTAIKVNSYLSSFDKGVDWVWFDCFDYIPPTQEVLRSLKLSGFKICIVSPELHILDRPEDEWHKLLFRYKQTLGSTNLIDGVCTKFPELWSK